MPASSAVKNLPPTKCLPEKNFTHGLGAVKLISVAGMNFAPGPSLGGPLSMSHELGASTLNTGTEEVSSCEIMDGNGSRRGPPNEKPKMASIIRSVLARAWGKSSGAVMMGTE